MLTTNRGRGWWGVGINGRRGELLAVLWFSGLPWRIDAARWRDGWDLNLGPLSLEWRRWA